MDYAPHASPRPRSAASPRWYSHPTSPFPGSCPPSPHQRAFEDGRAPAPPPYYASYDVPLPDAMPFPPFAGFDAFPPGSPARQSSRVEVLSSDTDGGHDTGASSAAAAAASASVPSRAGRARRLNSID
ncbi:hypothetical protein NESM_000804700 [Novymonas esmeraldas]|uniref:Uncharacterized protein n=1 Tax=Novymonas esmeraldas TaxID=1808958 RepID=A0AAW0EXD6_9TRYP